MRLLNNYTRKMIDSIACKNTGRNIIGTKLDETYFEIAKKRIEDGGELTGELTVL